MFDSHAVNRWLSIRFNLLSAGIVGATGLACLLTPSISASFAGFALAFATTITGDLLFMVRRFVGLEQSMVCFSYPPFSGNSKSAGCARASERIHGSQTRSA